MDASWLGLAEPILVFGGLLLFMHWQFRELRQRAKAREREAAEQQAREAAASAGSDGPEASRSPAPSHEPARHPPG